MNALCLFVPFFAVAAVIAPGVAVGAAESLAMRYPATEKGEQTDDYHGVKIADPYRWLEDANSDKTQRWVEEQNKVTFGYLRQIPSREGIRQRLSELWNYERYTVPGKESGRYFFSKNTGLQNQNVIFTAPSIDDATAGRATVLLDPNKLSEDGTVALSSYSISDDGKLMSYGVQTSGSDWIEWRLRDVATGKDLPDVVKWSKFSGSAWTKDGAGFFYSGYDAPDERTKLQTANYFQKLYYHKVGTPQTEDVLAYERKDQKEWGFGGTVTDDGKYLVVTVTQGTERKNRIFYRPLSAGPAGAPMVELLNSFDAKYSFIGNDGPTFYFLTNKGAPRGRIVAIETDKTAAGTEPALREIVPQYSETLQTVEYIGGRLVASYLEDAHTKVRVYGLDGKPLADVKFPGLGTASGFRGKPDDAETFFAFTSYTTPSTVYRYNVQTQETRAIFSPKVSFNPADYTTEQVFFKSKDGTRVPMFLTYKNGLKRDGQNATLLYGYGGFDISLTPGFSPANLVWLEMGGVYAVANLRGGGEYGEEWHQGGTKERKQNVFDDFIAAAEFLISTQVTSTPKLAIAGGSNGGLLVGAAMTQRPDLFGAAVPAVGVMDMLRFQKFTIGWAWTSDYGASDDPKMFPYLVAYSPLHHLKPGVCYPATMVTTSDHDDRVVPAHSFKFAATLQAAQGCDKPTLIRIETKSGHGAGRPTSKLIEEAADRWAFLDSVLNMDVGRAVKTASPPVDVPRKPDNAQPVPTPRR